VQVFDVHAGVEAGGEVVTADHGRVTRLLEERADWLVACAYLLTKDREQARDLAQDAMVQAWRARERVGAADAPERYLLRIMLNQYRSQLRRRRLRQVPLDEDCEHPHEAPASVGDLHDIEVAIRQLSPRQRVVIVLRYWADYDDTEIADVLGCRRTTVRSLAARGLTAIRQRVREDR
jgi:RNA polymerase sigma-70 factor (sigma-E family)